MPEIEVRPAVAVDIPALLAVDRSVTSDHVWQMAFSQDREAGEISVQFRQLRLPRSVRVDYPWPAQALAADWMRRAGLLVALMGGQPVGYISLELNLAPQTAWATDLVVDRKLRRQGIGSGLVFAAADWAVAMNCRYLALEMIPKNYPAIQLALKLGFEFCGYRDAYYPNQEIGIFFQKAL
jgi:ribosomal protein S18 acetylase RimI-like enzyme